MLTFVIIFTKRWHQTQWIAYANTHRLASDQMSAHGLQNIHYFRDPPLGWIRSVEWRIKRFACRRDDIFILSNT